MTRTVYVNGSYLPEIEATVSIFDRGFLMADGVYEVTSVLGGKLIDFGGHAARLERSLSELDMASPVTMAALLEIHRELVRRNAIDEGLIYLQITRGNPVIDLITVDRYDFAHLPLAAEFAIAETRPDRNILRGDGRRSIGPPSGDFIDPHQIVLVDIEKSVDF